MTQTPNTMSAGTLEPTFAKGGILRNFRVRHAGFTVFNEDEAFESAQDMAVMEDGRIVVCGIFSKDLQLRGGWALRYLN